MSAEKQITEQANRSPQEANEDNLLFVPIYIYIYIYIYAYIYRGQTKRGAY